jgi:MFS family permease
VKINKKPIYYGYVVVAASAVIMIVGYGINYSYSVFFDSLSSQFDWTKGAASWAFSIATLISGLLGIFAGRISDRLGPKAVSIFCGCAFGLGYVLMSLVQSPWQVYLIYGTFLAIGAGGLFPSAVSTVARWFTGKRGMMTGVVTAGMGIGTVIFAPLISRFIATYTWRTAYVIIGIISFVVIVGAAQFLKREPKPTDLTSEIKKDTRKITLPNGKDLTYRQAVRTKQFWMVAVIYFCFGYCQFSIMVHIVPFATGLSIDPISAAAVLSAIGASSIFGRLIIGNIGDRIRVKPLLISIMVFMLVSLVGLEFSQKLWALFIVGIIFGLGYGGSSTIQSLVTVELFGLSSLGALIGSLVFSVCIGGAIGPVLTGYLADTFDSYRLSILICIAVALTGLLLVFWLTPPKREK